jgi:hypothetical protein
MGNCDSCAGGRGPPPQSSENTSPSPPPKQFALKTDSESVQSGFVALSSGPINYRILPVDDATIKIQPHPKPPPRTKKPGGI